MLTKKRICTITHHTVPNYGAVLQTYALQKAIFNLGFNNEVLNYESDRVNRKYITKINKIKSGKQLIKYIVFPKEKLRAKKIRKFVDKYVKVSDIKYKRENLKDANNKYDLFITGSDQVWNLNIHEGDTSYMLDFVTDLKKKGSYAASFGYINVPDIYIDITKKNLQSFKFYNVREVQGKEILKNLIGKESNLVLDPTLLLKSDDYEKIMGEINIKKPYILVYNLTQSLTMIKFAKELAYSTGYKIVCINTSHKNVKGCININDASPEEFLTYIRNAEYVVTSSFHGIIFSLIFNKQFFYELNSKKNNNNSRLVNLGKLFDIENREIKRNKRLNEYIDINYSKINNIIIKEQKKSLNILKNMINQED